MESEFITGTTGFAIGILEEINFDDKQHPILQGILKYITSTASLNEKGWPWSVPSNNDYAHASWYTYDAGNKDAYLELTSIELAFFAVRHADEKSEIYKKAAMLQDCSILKSTNVWRETRRNGPDGVEDLLLLSNHPTVNIIRVTRT
ncbi:hypothetical protein [Kineothrix sedimenti]|uniref:Uncharacterized protein n=1 Tax=Kineothrix sedimenti TaxID=3123317 RepID=A0ABZ3ETQ1_9FIRM